MNLLRTTELKVGILVIGISFLIAYMTIGVSKDPSYLGRSKTYWFTLDDATGLIKNSNVKMAGIDVGIIKEISLWNGHAKIDVVLKPQVKVTSASSIEIRAQGILGDRYVEIVPGNLDLEDMPNGSQIMIVANKGSLDSVMNQVSNLTSSLSDIADTLKKSMTGDGDRSTPVGRIIGNLETLTGDIAEITSEKKGEVKEIVDNLHSVTGEIKALINDPSDEGFKASFEKFNRGLARFDGITKNFEEVSDKLNSGKGTLGRLINDDETADNINQTITNVNNFLGTANKLTTSIDFHTDYLTDVGEAKTFVSVRLQPGLDRYYELGIVDDPKGVRERVITDTTSGGGTTTKDETFTYKNKFKLTALFAKNFYDFTFKVGVIENSGGLGMEYHIIPKTLSFAFDAFDFAKDKPHLRAALRYSVFHGIYLVGGADDFLDKKEVTGYLGAGIDLTNDDIKYLMSKVSL